MVFLLDCDTHFNILVYNLSCFMQCLSLFRDKAGGYGIQAVGGTLVKAIHGDYYNVVGFPVNMFARRLTKHLQDGIL